MATSPVTTLMITGLGQGGAETQLTALACHLASCGWDTEVVSLAPPTDLAWRLHRSGIPIWSPGLPLRSSPNRVEGVGGHGWRLLGLTRHLRARRPQLLCTFMFHANVLGRVLGRLAGVPVVVSSIRNENFGSRWRERLEARTEGLASVTVVNSERVAASLVARGIVSADRCRVIRNAVDLGRFAPDHERRGSVRERLGIPPDAFLWLAVGRLDPKKDHASLLRAARELRRRHPGVRLAIAGEGPSADGLRQLSRALSLDGTVAWLGLRDDVPVLLDASDAFVLSSRWEGSPNVVVEALAKGLPVVSTNVGGVDELIEDGRSGVLVPPGDIDALTAAMARMMSLSLDGRRAMGERGRRTVLQRHDAAVVLEQWRCLLAGAWTSRRR